MDFTPTKVWLSYKEDSLVAVSSNKSTAIYMCSAHAVIRKNTLTKRHEENLIAHQSTRSALPVHNYRIAEVPLNKLF